MSDLWLALLPILLAMVISPARTLALILLLHTPKKALTGFAYVCGMITSMMIQGITFAILLSLIGLTLAERGGDLAIVVSTLFIVVGIVMLVGAAKFIFQEEEDDKPPPAWLEKIEHLSPREAYSTGIGWLMVSPKQWVFVLTAVAVIFTANLSIPASLANFFVFTLLVQSVFFLILIISVTMPERSTKILDGIFIWLKDHLRPVVIVIFSFFGLFFLIKGLAGLAG